MPGSRILAAVFAAAPTPLPPPSPSCAAGPLLVRVGCDPWGSLNALMSAVSFTLYRLMRAWWPLTAVAVAMALLVAALLAVVVRRSRRRAVGQARWVEIVPPATLPRDGALPLWQALTGMIHRRSRWGVVSQRLSVEFIADDSGLRAGVWVPPAFSVDTIADAIRHAWHGSRVTVHDRPPSWVGLSCRAVEVLPRGGEWTPLINPGARPVWAASDSGADGLRGVLATLARRGPGEVACVQLVVTAHSGIGGGHRPLWHRVVRGLLRAARRVLLVVLDLVQEFASSGHRHPQPPRVQPLHAVPDDPALAARARAVDGKRADGPHLRVTLRAGCGRPGRGRVTRSQMQAIADGFDLAVTETSVYTRPVRRSAVRLSQRRTGARFNATVEELAALWHLPAQPGTYGMTDSAARIRAPRRDMPRMTRRRPDNGGGRDAAA